jgi:formylglycine-generating enzyme required for sulfatase activity/CheY-like chemotaxis protein
MRILLVDDDTGVIQSLLAVLRAQPDYEVRAATHGEKALENAAALGGIDLLITDVVMEPMDGFTLRDEMQRRYPQLRTIFISGYDLTEYQEQTHGAHVIAKPIEPVLLLETIEHEFASEQDATPGAETLESHRAAGASAVVTHPHVAAPAPPADLHPTGPAHAAAARAAAPLGDSAMAQGGQADSETIESEPEINGGSSPPLEANSVPVSDADATGDAQESAPDSIDPLIGMTIGTYQIVRRLGGGRLGNTYAAVQASINRHVGLKILDATRQRDPATKARFIADARAKAHVQHPSIVSVYEAGEADGHIFYAHEYVEGGNLAEAHASGERIDEPTVLKVLRSVAEGLAYLHAQSTPHSPLEPSKIYLGVDGHPRLANLATQYPEQQLTPQREIQILGRIILSVALPVQQLSPGLRTLLSRMVQPGPNAINTWGPLVQGVKALEPKVIPVEVAKISAADRAAIGAVEAARRQRKKSLLLTIAAMAATLVAVLWVLWHYFISNERMLEEKIDIPAGTYLIGPGADPVHLEAFSIDKYEVTIGQYAKFVAYFDKHPDDPQFNHLRQPRHLSHRPRDWEIYYRRAKAGQPVHKVPTDLNSPVMMVTWWDAYAYAKWKGRELPTEQQWEAAARGPKGFIYPWGDQFDPKKVNSNADYNSDEPGAKGDVDGYNFWSPVDALRSDKSPFGVIGMAGNVSEWVDTWTPDNRFPVVKGGNYLSADVRLDKRSTEYEASRAEEHIGFRTVSSKSSKPTK